jgi:hypothetical protein
VPRIRYEQKKLRADSLALIARANVIITNYANQGFSLTVRQLYYQLVTQNVIPNTEASYKKIIRLISDARRAGLIDWNAIEDRTRMLRVLNMWTHPRDVLHASASQFRMNPWDQQDTYVEVWFEKDALMGVFQKPCNTWRLPYFSCRGYASDSEVWAAAQRLAAESVGRDVLILHFGDHDPSGLDMTRDIGDRVRLFASNVERRGEIEVRRLALTMEQVEEYQPPPNPAKETDARFAGYQAQYGDESWELDALTPTVLAALIEDNVRDVIDDRKWEYTMTTERSHRKALGQIADRYEDVRAFVRKGGPA